MSGWVVYSGVRTGKRHLRTLCESVTIPIRHGWLLRRCSSDVLQGEGRNKILSPGVKKPLYTDPPTPSAASQQNQISSPQASPYPNTDSLHTTPHTPVMVKEVLDILSPRPGQVLLDLTFGAGGHTRALLESEDGVRVVCLDRDPSTLTHAAVLQQDYPGRVLPLLGCFRFESPGLFQLHS